MDLLQKVDKEDIPSFLQSLIRENTDQQVIAVFKLVEDKEKQLLDIQKWMEKQQLYFNYPLGIYTWDGYAVVYAIPKIETSEEII